MDSKVHFNPETSFKNDVLDLILTFPQEAARHSLWGQTTNVRIVALPFN